MSGSPVTTASMLNQAHGNVLEATFAAQRALTLLRVLDREHDVEELHRVMRAVRHEVETVARFLGGD